MRIHINGVLEKMKQTDKCEICGELEGFYHHLLDKRDVRYHEFKSYSQEETKASQNVRAQQDAEKSYESDKTSSVPYTPLTKDKRLNRCNCINCKHTSFYLDESILSALNLFQTILANDKEFENDNVSRIFDLLDYCFPILKDEMKKE